MEMNQFNISQVQGSLDLQNGVVLSCVVDAAETTQIVAGQAVKLATTGGGTPKVLALTANTQGTFGFVVRNLKDVSRGAGETLEVAIKGSVMYMTAGEAINPAQMVEVVYTTNKVIVSDGVNPIVGMALDKASADGDLIRVLIETPSVVQPITLDSINDVVLTSPTNTQVLKYNGTSWVNAADAT